MKKILVIGEYCTDVFIYCETSRLSPEAPVPVLVPVDVNRNPGMAGNVIQNLKSLLPNCNVVGNYQHEYITKTRYIDKKTNHMFIRVDEGEDKIGKFSFTENTIQSIMDSDIVIVSDYDKGYLDLQQLERIGMLSKLSILDSKRKLTNNVVNSYSFVKLNEGEANTNENLLYSQNIIITLGGKGAMCRGVLYPTTPQETIDVSGAGDTFTAGFIVKYYETKDIESSIKYANKLASIVVAKRGVATP